MLAEIGWISLTLAFIACLYAIVASVVGERTHHEGWVISGRNASLATFPLLLISCGALLVALMTQQYQISYVWSVTEPSTPDFYRFTALWGSQRGSLLFWCLTMSVFSAGAVYLNWKSDRRLMPYAIAFMMATLAFFVGITLLLENPFSRWWLDATTGAEIDSVLIPANAIAPDPIQLQETAHGLNPLLRHFGMIIHPPMLYLGFVGFTVPFAFAMAALASGDLTTNWIKATRRWTLVAWLFLGLGLILGGRWAYDVLGWGGYWGWDPVENAAFLPWLVGTAFLHSVMIQEKRGMLKVWNMTLVILTFSAVMFGTFATRSGVIESVHSFARSEVGMPMLLFWASITLVAVVMLLYRWNRGELRDEHPFVGLLSRETLFVLNNVIFVALTIAIFWGSFGAPIMSELVFNTDITLGKEYFMSITPPLFAIMYVLMGIAPLTAWTTMSIGRLGNALFVPFVLTTFTLIFIVMVSQANTVVSVIAYGVVFMAGYVAVYEIVRGVWARVKTRGENPLQATLSLFARNQRRYGGYIVHLGITVIGIGVIGSTLFQLETRQIFQQGQTIAIDHQYALRYDSFEEGISADGRAVSVATLTLFRNGDPIATLQPRIDDFEQMDMTIAGAYGTLEKDIYLLLLGYDSTTQEAIFKIYINPLVNLVWWGGIILIIGTVLAAYPKEIVPETVRQPKRFMVTATA
jgi:cytochrome c-type biogenesis protein CcmF